MHLCPSIKEGWGLVVNEAGGHEVPTVGYRSAGGLRESILDGVTGVLVDDLDEMTDAVARLLEDDLARKTMGAEAARHAASLEWPATVRSFAAVLARSVRGSAAVADPELALGDLARALDRVAVGVVRGGDAHQDAETDDGAGEQRDDARPRGPSPGAPLPLDGRGDGPHGSGPDPRPGPATHRHGMTRRALPAPARPSAARARRRRGARMTTTGAPTVPVAVRRRRHAAVPAALVSLALLGVNMLAYVFTVVAARLLAPEAYGELAALLGVMFIGVVPMTGLQTAAALTLGRRPDDQRLVTARLHAAMLAGAVTVGAVGLLAVGPLVSLLHLQGPSTVLWLVAVLVPHTLVGGYDGLLQGSGRYGRLAVVTGMFGVLKTGGGVTGLVVGGTPEAALIGMAVGCAVSALLGWVITERPGLARGARPHVLAAARASGALLGLVLLVNLDVLLARHHLPAELAGEYAVASIFAKVAFWLPQGVSVVLLPRLANARGRRRLLPAAVALVASSGIVLTALTAVLGARALPLVGGEEYGAALGGATWVFALLGTLLALAQLLLYSGIAAADRVAAVAVWCAVVLEAAAVELFVAWDRLTVLTVAGVAVAASVLLVATGLVRAWRAHTAGVGEPA